MSITTFAELKTAMGNWLDRTDLSSRLAEFIALYESEVNRELIVRQQITSTTLTPSSGSASLPNDYLAWKKVTWTGATPRVLQYVDPNYLDARFPNSDNGSPIQFTIEGSTLKVRPVDDTGLTFLYAQKVPALSDSATTNWLLTAHPDAYLFGSLTMAATFTEDAAQGSAWNALKERAHDALFASDLRHHGPMTMKTLGPTP